MAHTATVNRDVVAGPPPASRPRSDAVPSGIDADKDGFFAGQDCNDNNAAIRPGRARGEGQHLDENCDGLAEPFPTLTSGVGEQVGREGLELTMTAAAGDAAVPEGLEGEDLCKGSKCPFKSKT